MRKADMIRLHFILLLVKAIFKIVRLLCDHGADIETHDKWGMRTSGHCILQPRMVTSLSLKSSLKYGMHKSMREITMG
jgi:hypothetical protein